MRANPVPLSVTRWAAAANTGTGRPAARWARLLHSHYGVFVQAGVDGGALDHAANDAACMIALHARRSHPAICAWRARHGARPLIVVLTGTDLYRDVPEGDSSAAASLATADALIVLQADALHHVPEPHRAKARVVHQSAPSLQPALKSASR